MADDQNLAEQFPLANPYDCDVHLSVLAMTGLNALARRSKCTVHELGEQAILASLRTALPEFVPNDHAIDAAELAARVRRAAEGVGYD